MADTPRPSMLILNQMAGPMTWELVEDLGAELDCVALLTGHPDTLLKINEHVLIASAAIYQRGSFPRRAISWLHYTMQAFIWLWRWPGSTPLLLYSNPPILCWLGWLMNRLRYTPYSVMVHDIYPDVLVRVGGVSESHILVRLWRWLNRYAYEQADLVMTLGENMADTLSLQFDPQKTEYSSVLVAYPWVDTEVFHPIPKDENWFAQEHDQVGKLTVMYSGNMGLGHDINTMLAAAGKLVGEEDIEFLFIGDGPKKEAVEKALKSDLNNVTLLDWQSEEVFPFSLATADISLVSLDQGMEGLAIPSKAIYAMAAGSTILALTSGENELKNWIEKYALGAVVEPGDVDGLVQSIRCLNSDAGSVNFQSISRSVAERHFSRSVISRQIIVPLFEKYA